MCRARSAPVLLLLLCSGMLSACASLDPNANADRIAGPAQLRRETLHTEPFRLTSFVRIGAPREPIHLYIEGDGRAWQSRTTPSSDPTPQHAMGLQLAAKDPAANVVYIARPCQFSAHDPHCEVAYWTGKRFSPEVIAAVNEAVSHYAALAPGQPVHLIGYSGGGTLAVLIAARRQDVASIRTIAGDLDLDAVTRLHGVSPMPQSLNPIREAQHVAAIPQIHFSGADDQVIPPAIAAAFASAVGGACVQTQTIAGIGHAGRWPEIWPAMLAQIPRCESPSTAPT